MQGCEREFESPPVSDSVHPTHLDRTNPPASKTTTDERHPVRCLCGRRNATHSVPFPEHDLAMCEECAGGYLGSVALDESSLADGSSSSGH